MQVMSDMARKVSMATGGTSAAEAPTPELKAAKLHHPRSDFATLVSIEQGTDSTEGFSNGNTLPICARPFEKKLAPRRVSREAYAYPPRR